MDLPNNRVLDDTGIETFRSAEEQAYIATRPNSRAAMEHGAPGYLGGLPFHWMEDWPMPFPFVAAHASGATIEDIDGNRLNDFCLGDTGSMFGHSPKPIAEAMRRQAGLGLTTMLPGNDALTVGKLLQERFRLPFWQVATTASDANRFALRVAREVTGRARILVFNGCYHGAVDETMVCLEEGKPINRASLAGEFRDLTQGTAVVEFNDLEALEAALSKRDIACVITEPVMTNCSMVLPDPGFHAGLRALTAQYGTLLLIDETHTISSGLGGYSAVHNLDPDIFVLGKPIAGGVPASIWGLSDEVARRYLANRASRVAGFSGIGTTLSASPLQFACMRAVLEEIMTAENYRHMEQLATRLDHGLCEVIRTRALPFHVVRVGARVEFICAPGPLRNGTEAAKAHAPRLEGAIHLGLVNRGSLIAPFHNMMLLSPSTTAEQVDQLVASFDDVTQKLMC